MLTAADVDALDPAEVEVAGIDARFAALEQELDVVAALAGRVDVLEADNRLLRSRVAALERAARSAALAAKSAVAPGAAGASTGPAGPTAPTATVAPHQHSPGCKHYKAASADPAAPVTTGAPAPVTPATALAAAAASAPRPARAAARIVVAVCGSTGPGAGKHAASELDTLARALAQDLAADVKRASGLACGTEVVSRAALDANRTANAAWPKVMGAGVPTLLVRMVRLTGKSTPQSADLLAALGTDAPGDDAVAILADDDRPGHPQARSLPRALRGANVAATEMTVHGSALDHGPDADAGRARLLARFLGIFAGRQLPQAPQASHPAQ